MEKSAVSISKYMQIKIRCYFLMIELAMFLILVEVQVLIVK